MADNVGTRLRFKIYLHDEMGLLSINVRVSSTKYHSLDRAWLSILDILQKVFRTIYINIHLQIVKIVPFSPYHRRKYGSSRFVSRSCGFGSGF